jgi:peptidyl-prolyl cis-trans isomerase C
VRSNLIHGKQRQRVIRWGFILLLLIPVTSLPAEKDPVATVGGVEISATELGREIGRLRNSKDLKQALKAMDSDRQREILEEYIDRKLLVLGAMKEGIDREVAVAAEIKDATEMILSEAYLANKLEPRLTPQAAKDFFDKNSTMFQLPPKIKARHILLKTADDAEAALKRVKGGEDFCKVAAVSIDTATSGKCGELGWIQPGIMVKSFEDYLFGLKPGDQGAITGTSYGYHLVQVTERKESESPRFESVSTLVMQKMKQKLLDDMRHELRREFPVSIK